MATAHHPTSHPVRGSVPGSFEQVDELRWAQLEELAQTLRPLACLVLSRSMVEGLVQRFGVDRSTIYRYRARLLAIDETLAIAGHKRGWKPLASRLSLSQEQVIEQAIKVMRKKAGPLRVVDLVEEVSVLCRLHEISCPSRPAIDQRLMQAREVRVRRRGVAPPGNADPRISPGTFCRRTNNLRLLNE